MHSALNKNTKLGLTVASVIFAIFGMLHVLRLLKHGCVSVTIAGHAVPIAASAIAAPVFLLLAFWLWTLRKQ